MWLRGQSWSTWIKITLFLVIIIASIGLTGGWAGSEFLSAIR